MGPKRHTPKKKPEPSKHDEMEHEEEEDPVELGGVKFAFPKGKALTAEIKAYMQNIKTKGLTGAWATGWHSQHGDSKAAFGGKYGLRANEETGNPETYMWMIVIRRTGKCVYGPFIIPATKEERADKTRYPSDDELYEDIQVKAEQL